MIAIDYAKKYCYQDLSLIENYDKAISDKTQTWICHHRNEIIMNCTAKELMAKGCYYDRPAHELIFLTKSQHVKLHNTVYNGFLGRHHSSTTISYMSQKRKANPKGCFVKGSNIGYKWWTNGVIEKRCKECPSPDFVRGRLTTI